MRGTGYNVMRDDKEFLDENSSSPPSFSIYLYPEHWTLNNGPKFLYTHQVSSLLDDIRAYRIPTDFIELFHTAKVPYYNGCLIVELLDYRPVRAKEPILEKPDIQRVLLHPNPETIWADVCALNQRCGSKWMDMDALEVEARILMATAPPLCLDPDAHLTRMVNNVVRATTPNTPHSLKRKALLADPEEDETDKAKRIKIMQFMNPQANKPTFVPSYRILALKERRAALQNGQTLSNGAHPSVPPVPGPASSAIPAPLPQAVPHQNGNYDDPSKRNVTSNPPTHPPTPVSANSQQHNPHRSDSPQQPPSATMPPPQIPQQSYQQHVSVDPSKRMSPAKSKTSLPGPSPIISHAQPQQPASSAAAQSQGQPQRSQTPGFQPPIPSANFLNQPPAGKKKQPPPQKPRTPATQTQPLPQQPPPQPQPPMTGQPPQAMQNFQAYVHAQQQIVRQMHAQQQQHAQQQGQNQNGRHTPAPNMLQNPAAMTRSPMISSPQVGGRGSPAIPGSVQQQTQQMARSSPLAPGQPLNRGPVPQGAQQQQTQGQPHHPQQMAHLPQTMMAPQAVQQHNFAVPPGQFNPAHMRPMHPHMQQFAQPLRPQPTPPPQPGQHPQTQQQGVPQQSSQDQQQATAQMLTGMQFPPPHMYNYAQMSLAVPGMPQQYGWRVGVGRGAPQAMSGQHIPGMPPGMPMQQLQGIGRAMQGGVQQGR